MTDLEFTEELIEPSTDGQGVGIDDFCAFMPAHVYIFMPCCEFWPAASVNARLDRVPVLTPAGLPKKAKGKAVTIPASLWLDQNRPVEQMCWAPGLPKLIRDRLVVDGGWIERKGVTCFNLYRLPQIKLGNAAEAGPWIEHVHRVFDAPGDAKHIITWLAHRVQRPAEKINHALLLGGAQGIGKDTILEPVKRAVGHWNFKEVAPAHLLGRFNSFAKAVILRVNEARDLGDVERVNRFSFYDHCKSYICTPPDVVRVDEKHLREQYVFNVLGFIITTNHKTDGIFLPPDDRRHYVAWSNHEKEEFSPEYWQKIWGFYEEGGYGHVAAYLNDLDISGLDPKAPPPKTEAFWDIVNASLSPEDGELADTIDSIGNPGALTIAQLIAGASGEATQWLMDRRNRRAVPHRLERCGYVSVRNPGTKDGRWKVAGSNQMVYAKAELLPRERFKAAQGLALSSRAGP
jgi:hypothetical protein